MKRSNSALLNEQNGHKPSTKELKELKEINKNQLENYIESNKKQSFLNDLFNGVYKGNEFASGYDPGLLYNIPRGVKYHFPNCQKNGKFFNL